MNDALLWDSVDGGPTVACRLCSHRCHIDPGKHGVCTVRVNDAGALRTRVYGRAVAEHVDPIEKKPLYHFLPSSTTFSIAAVGCNMKCAFCQNWSISQASGQRVDDGGIEDYGSALTPEKIVAAALMHKCDSVSFTYTEPTVFFEYALATAKIAKAEGLRTIFVSNGYMTPECLDMIGPYLDACNIDLKSFRNDFYRRYCGATLAPVLESLKKIRAMGIWLEVTTLVITGENDSAGELEEIAGFIGKELGSDVPWHVSRFFPNYCMSSRDITGAPVIEMAVKVGKDAGLSYVYAGNIDIARDTSCPGCGETVISRCGYRTDLRKIDTAAGSCRGCGAKISGIFF